MFQPPEQAGFRHGYSTIDHIHAVRQLIEKTHEYNQPLYLTLIDFEKAFDTVEKWALINSLKRCRIDHRYITLIDTLYQEATITIQTFDETKPIEVKRGIRQGDTISPKLFTNCLEDSFKLLNWDTLGININGERLNNLRFADDIVLISDNMEDIKKMTKDLREAAGTIGLKMNINKTKVMSNREDATPIEIEGEKKIEIVEEYIYLGQLISLSGDCQVKEVERRIQLGWAAYGKLRQVFRSSLPQHLKTRIFNQCILPILTYASETWPLTETTRHKLQVTQRKMERSMLGIRLQDMKRNEWIRNKTRADDVIQRIAKLKWQWAGHVMRLPDERWTKKVTEWRPRMGKRNPGRPRARWRDDIQKHAGKQWTRKTHNRQEWHEAGEAYIQEWSNER